MAAILVGLAGFTLYGIAMVMMKYGADVLASPGTMFRGRENVRKSAIWILGFVLNTTYVLLFTIALGMGKASVISALNGFGLVVAAILSGTFLKERISRTDIVGILLIVAGTFGVGYWGGSQAPGGFTYSPNLFIVYCAVVLGGNLVAGFIVIPMKFRGAGFVYAINAGCLGGIAALCQKLFVTPLMAPGQVTESAVAFLMTNPYFWIFAVLALGAFAMIQVAYQFGQAILVVPTYSATIILSPLIGAVIAFHEGMNAPQIAAVGCILAGILFLAGFPKKDRLP